MSGETRGFPRPALEIPPTWEWARFDLIAEIAADLVSPSATPTALHLAPDNIEPGTGKLLACRTVSEDGVTSPKQRFVRGDLIYSKIRPHLNKATIAPFAGLCSADMYPVKPRLNTRYLLHYMLSETFVQQSTRHQGRSILPKINQAALKELHVPVAPADEQRRIADEIDTLLTNLDAGVGQVANQRAKLAAYRAAVLRAACEGRLVPTEAELARGEGRELPEPGALRWIREAREPLPAWAEDDLPVGWMWAAVGQILAERPANGISIKGTDAPPGTPSLRLSAMTNSGFDFADVKYLPLDDARAADLRVRDGDFFVSRGNGSLALVGRGTLARGVPRLMVFPDLMIRLRPAQDVVSREYLATIWPAYVVRKQVERSAKTTAGIYKISQPQLEAIRIPIPPSPEQHRIVAEVERRLSVVERLEAAIDANLVRAKRLRQAILNRAFEGRLVPQDANDEPASVLLERIRKEREASPVKRRQKRGAAR